MSRPWSSVPSQNVMPDADFSPGGSLLSSTSICARSYGFCGEITGASIATSTMTISIARPTTAIGLSMKSRQMRRSGDCAARGDAAGSVGTSRTELTSTSALRVGQAHARIERRVQHVDGEVDHDEERDEHEAVSDDDRPIEEVDRIDQQLAHAGPREHALGDDGECDQRAELQADHRDDGNEDVAQHVD